MFEELKAVLRAGSLVALKAFGQEGANAEKNPDEIANSIIEAVSSAFSNHPRCGFYSARLVCSLDGQEIGFMVFSGLGHVSPILTETELSTWRGNCYASITKEGQKFPYANSWHTMDDIKM